MPSRSPAAIDESRGPIRRALRYAFYDWTREMPKPKRIVTWAGILIQGYAIYAGFTRSLVWPLLWPHGLFLVVSVWLLYLVGSSIMNGMLTSEFVRKTQLEADQIAARQIQKTLQPEELEEMAGYETEIFYRPYRSVGGDYFDVIELPGNRTLFAVADVSGKGMPAALLAANIQALVRSLANVEADPPALAKRINRHLCRYTPGNRFATAVFLLLTRDSGELTYVNAGHNAPIVYGSGAGTSLGATGMPMGFFSGAEYESGRATVPSGGGFLLFTDGLTDSIPGDDPEGLLRKASVQDLAKAMSDLQSLMDPRLIQDDVTILLVKRASEGSASAGALV